MSKEFEELKKRNIRRYKSRRPSMDDIDYVFEKAAEGNEMAAIFINEWSKNLSDFPKKEGEKLRQIIDKVFLSFK